MSAQGWGDSGSPHPSCLLLVFPWGLGMGRAAPVLQAAVQGAQRNHGPYRTLEMGILGKGGNGVLGRLGVRGLVLATSTLPSRVGP